jgi:hypothetical protein
MPLTMRPTGLGAGIDKDRPDYGVYCGEWAIAGWAAVQEPSSASRQPRGGGRLGKAMMTDDPMTAARTYVMRSTEVTRSQHANRYLRRIASATRPEKSR